MVQIAILAILGAITCIIFGVAGILLLDRLDSSTPDSVAVEAQTPRATARLPPTRTPTLPPTPTPASTSIPTSVPTSAPVQNSGWTLYEYPGDKFSIALPDTWVQLDMEAKTVEAALAPIREYYPDFEMPYLETKGMAGIRADGIKLLAFDTETRTERVANVNVFLQSLDEFVLDGRTQNKDEAEVLDAVVQAVLQGNVQQGEEMLEHQRITLPIGEAEKITETDEVGSQVIVQYLFVHQEALCMVTFSSTSDLLKAYTPAFEKIIHSFRWIE